MPGVRAGAFVLCALLLSGQSAYAQASDAAASDATGCVPRLEVMPRASGEATPSALLAVCGEAAVSLGYGDRYETSVNEAAKALVVSRWIGDMVAVSLVLADPDGTMHVDDVSAELARQLGGYEARDLRAVRVDLSDFPTEGTVAVTSIKPPAKTAAPTTSRLADTASRSLAAASTNAPSSSATIDLTPYRTLATAAFAARAAADAPTTR